VTTPESRPEPYVPLTIPWVLVSGPGGAACMTVLQVCTLLRAYANTIRANVGSPTIGFVEIAYVFDMEADTLSCRAMEFMTHPPEGEVP